MQRIRSGEENEMMDYAEEMDYSEFEEQNVFDLSGVYASDGDGLKDEESILSVLIQQARDFMRSETDAKLEAFVIQYQALREKIQDSTLKVIIFTEFRTTQKMLFDKLNTSGYQCTIIYGSQEIDQRKASLSKFRREAQILIATDASGESLNMQFCHIIFNDDLPWNPMMIEQRIGRIDRIGQKKKVKAFNMLINNSVDLRVYEVIEEKLNNILQQLGIDKTSDVLDSTIDMKKVNKLYLQSLLDPSKFEFAGDKWLMEIRAKLKDY